MMILCGNQIDKQIICLLKKVFHLRLVNVLPEAVCAQQEGILPLGGDQDGRQVGLGVVAA